MPDTPEGSNWPFLSLKTGERRENQPNQQMKENRLSKEEHIVFAHQCYIMRNALMSFMTRYRPGSASVKQAHKTLRQLDELKNELDRLYCASFPGETNSSNADFRVSPYFSMVFNENSHQMTDQIRQIVRLVQSWNLSSRNRRAFEQVAGRKLWLEAKNNTLSGFAN
jgi:hypothetical protein